MAKKSWASLADQASSGAPCKLTAEHRHALQSWINKEALSYQELHRQLKKVYQVNISVTTLRNELKRLGYVHKRTKKPDTNRFKYDTTQVKQKDIEYQAIIEASFSGFWCNDTSGRFLNVNTAVCSMLGYSEQELLTMSIMDIEAAENPAETAAHIKTIIQTGHDRFETRHRRKDGHIVYVDLAVKCVRKPDGKPDYFIGMMLDITERKQVEAALKANEAFTASILNSLISHIAVLDEHGTIIMVNEAWKNFAAQNGVPDYLHANYLQVCQNALAEQGVSEILRGISEVLAGRQTHFDAEYSYQSATEQLWFYMRVSPLQGAKRGAVISHENITDRKKAEHALIEKESLLSESQRIARLGSWVFDAAGKIWWSDEAYRIWGQTAGEFIPDAESFTALIHPDDRAAMQTWTEDCFAGNKPSELEFRTVLPHNKVRILIGRGELKQKANGQAYLAGTIQDVTERKLVEWQVQQSEERLNLSQEYGGIGSWEADLVNNTQIWSRAVYQLLGFPPLSNPTWNDFLAVIHPEDRQAVMDANQAHLSHREKYDVEYRAALADGQIHWLRSAGQAQFAPDGTALKFIGIVQDITKRKQVETELRIAATVFESQEGMIIADANCIILKVNHAFTVITGYSETESIGQTPRFLKSERHDKLFYAALWQSINDTGAWQGEIWDKRKNGECYPQWLTITAVKGNDDIVTHYVATLTDITERKAIEERINNLAFYDPLTQLPNRRLLQERLKHGIEVYNRTGSQMAVMMMDLDKFKAVNDTLGHAAGDVLLQQVAERIKARLREVDMVARLGGDEFVIVIEEVIHYEDIAHIAEAIIHTLSQTFTLYDIHKVTIGCSIGIAFHPQHGDSVEALMDNADTALYYAKDQGRGCYAYFCKTLKQKP